MADPPCSYLGGSVVLVLKRNRRNPAETVESVGEVVYGKSMINRFAHLAPSMTRHFKAQVAEKELDKRSIIMAWRNPERVYPSGSHPGQWRITGFGVCIVGVPDGEHFTMITCYEDGVLTAPRADQMATPEGRAYAARRAQGLGRGA